MKKAVALLTIVSILLPQSSLYIIDTPMKLVKPINYVSVNAAPNMKELTEVSVVPNKVTSVTSPFIEEPSSDEDTNVETFYTINIDIPTHTDAKTYEDGKYITNKSSSAYEWLSKCSVDERGHYMYDDKYHAVAMGNYFDDVGSKYCVTLDTGRIFYIIKCDVKQDKHTTNRIIDSSGAMIEFIIDENMAEQYYGIGENGYILNGNFNNREEFQGRIISMEQIKE